jgi:hypothetical protein
VRAFKILEFLKVSAMSECCLHTLEMEKQGDCELFFALGVQY